MTWVLFLWIGAANPAIVQGFTSEEKCVAFAEKVNSPYQSNERKKFQCIKVEK